MIPNVTQPVQGRSQAGTVLEEMSSMPQTASPIVGTQSKQETKHVMTLIL